MEKVYDCIIVGSGIAGLQAAIQLGRYMHNVLVIDNNNGRSNLCRAYHNILGWPEGISGQTLRDIGYKQAFDLGINFSEDFVKKVQKQDNSVTVYTKKGENYQTKTLLIATGVKDNIPNIENITPCLGISIYICPDCDGYEIRDKRVIVLGSGQVGANLAIDLTYWTKMITYINNQKDPVDPKLLNRLEKQGITLINGQIETVLTESESNFQGVRLNDGQVIFGEKGFLGFGGNIVHSELAKQLGVELLENKHILVDPRTKETNITNVWAAGDVVAHSEQVTIAMADGLQAAIWIHKRLMKDIS